MSREFRLLGHPLHPILNHVPIGLLSITVPFDVLGLWLGSPFWWAVSYWNIVAALVAAAPTVLSGFVDNAAFVRGSRPERLVVFHLTFMLCALGVFALSLVFRPDPEQASFLSLLAPLGFDCLGTLLLMIGGWFGGELVCGHGVGLRATSGVQI
jgi:uncharacterized membrane protein